MTSAGTAGTFETDEGSFESLTWREGRPEDREAVRREWPKLAADGSIAPRFEKGPIGQLGEMLVRPWVYWWFHSWRLFGYLYVLPFAAYFRPRKTAVGLASYMAVHRQLWWQRAVHAFFRYGVSKRHRMINPNPQVNADGQRYLITVHPHSILADGWHSVVGSYSPAFERGHGGPPFIDRGMALCFAPIIQHVPIHQEMYRDLCCGSSRKEVERWWKTPDSDPIDPVLIPGGFSESVFANSGDKKIEYAFLKDRFGFMRIALENGKDILPCYTFGASKMYYNPPIMRGLRARFSQKYYLPAVLPLGKWGTSMPLTDETATVVFPPFEASKYKADQLKEAHAAYLAHMKKYFDKYKADYGMADYELQFVGDDFVDDDFVSRGLRRLGLMSNKKVESSTAGKSKGKRVTQSVEAVEGVDLTQLVPHSRL
eukprot:gnl/TRDRNA2_/TRDRNA2_48624_c0_seq1.p1 gnl/TRDRNA2_/TRDRNA2_48624_c0~~gnl/TRDRNA2_/TRDRNA2_48624_c0_seq1.p1  ORF type:complete len:427 (-),score=59.01 gnl/TRDRNA2_/TRDRNA2_48624_c0_seq1:97-1377(-)